MPPVTVSPAIKVPFTLEATTTPCVIFPELVKAVTFCDVVPFAPNNSNWFALGFLTVNTSVAWTAAPPIVKLGVKNLICCPSFNPWPVEFTTPGFATVILPEVIAFDVVVDKLSTVAVAPEVLPVIFSPVVNVVFDVIFKCVNILISNR